MDMNSRALCSTTIALILLLGLVSVRGGSAQALDHFGLVIQYQDGKIDTYCIKIDHEPFKGIDALERAGLELGLEYNGSTGSAVCKIGRDGCAPDNCFCNMPNYWTYWHLGKDSQDQPRWIYSQLGASSYNVTGGSVEGWRFGPGQQPEVLPAFDEVCRPPTDTPAQTATQTATYTQAPTFDLPPSTTPTRTSAAATPFTLRSTPRRGGSLATAMIIGETPTATATPAPPTATVTPAGPTQPPPIISPTMVELALAPTVTAAVVERQIPTTAATEKVPRVRPTRTPRPEGTKPSTTPVPTWGKKNPSRGPATAVSMVAAEAQTLATPIKVESNNGRLKIAALTVSLFGGAAAFLGFFAILSLGLVVVIIWKRH